MIFGALNWSVQWYEAPLIKNKNPAKVIMRRWMNLLMPHLFCFYDRLFRKAFEGN